MKILLLVTWFYVGQQPASYHVAFASMEACNQGAAAIKADAKRIADAFQTRVEVSAVCVAGAT